MADPDQGQELQHQPVGRRRSCALALVAADAGPLPAKGVGSREAQPAHEVRQENFEEDDHIATESRAARDLYVYFTCYIYMQEGTRKRRKRRGEERREAGGGHDSREIKTKARGNYLTLDLESNFEKLRKTRIFGFFSILQFLVSALEIPSRFRFRSGTLDFSSFGTMDLLVRRRPE